MSGYFKCNKVWVIVPTAEVTNEMVNRVKLNYNSNQSSLRTSNDGTQTLFKLEQPISSVFNNYQWYNEVDIREKLETDDWVPDI